MNKFLKRLDKIRRNKRKLTMFLFGELCVFTVLVTALTYTIIKKNTAIETSEMENIEIKQNETPEIYEQILEIDEAAQELTEDEQEEAEKKENIEKKDDKKTDKNSSQVPSGYSTSYYIKVNYGANVVTVYSKSADGSYTPIKAMICSTGRATPKSGVYSLKSTKHRWGALFGGVWGQYTTQIVGNILFHSVPYLSANPSKLEYWEYDKLGTTASAGCVRLKVCDAKWIYECMPAGTPVEFYSDSNPGPLGKPGAQKISGNEQCRGWDPTDSDGSNPWRNVAPEPEPQPQPAPKPTQQNTQQETKKTEQPKEEKKPEQNKEENKDKQEQPKQDDKENKTEEPKPEEKPKEEKPQNEITGNKDNTEEKQNTTKNDNTNT